jgi:CheY-like chemotaxis protein
MAQPRLNLSKISVLLVDRNSYSRALISQALRGFGIIHILACDSAAAAQRILSETAVDLCLIEAELPDMTAPDLIRIIRRLPKEPLRFVPIIMLSGYTQFRMLSAARDAGANLVVKKPVSPQILFDRIGWLGRTKRAYIEANNYSGPDRRFRDIDPPDGAHKRATDKHEDASPDTPARALAESAAP